MEFTSLPNYFFSTLLPQISDMAELKTTLYVMALLYRKRGYPRFVAYRELLGNASLIGSLGEASPPDEALRNALEMAARRGTIIHLVLDRDGAPEDIYLLNTEPNRQTAAKIQSGEVRLSGLKEGAPPQVAAEKQPDIFGSGTPSRKPFPSTKGASGISSAFWSAGQPKVKAMEHISDILKRTQTNTSKASMDTWSSAEEEASPGPDCPVCQGAGVIHPLLPSGKPDFSHVVACRCTRKEMGKERQDRLQRYSHLGLLTRLTFENLLLQGRSGNPANQEQFRQAYEAAKAFATEPKGWFVLSGPSGCGKTHLAAAIANERLDHGYPVFYITTPDLLDHLRSTYSPGSEIPYDDFFNQVRNAPLVVLDDLGAQTGTPWAKEKLDQLLTHRFNSELPTVVVTIVPIEQLDERLHTRLTDPRLCQVHVIEATQPSVPDYTGGLGLELLKRMTFDTFDHKRVNLPPEQRDNLEQVFREALNFAQSPEGWLILVGINGCGKTPLAVAIANYRLQAGQPALFIVVAEFLDHLRSTFSPESRVSYDQLFESAKNAPLLILDDFGEQSTTSWAQEKLYQVINYRYNARLATVITTSYSLDEIENRISSRLVDPRISLVLNIMAPDYRGDLRSGQRRTARGAKKGRWS